MLFVVFFFFQAEDGIRDADVTGVQTCALPIWRSVRCTLLHSNCAIRSACEVRTSATATLAEHEVVHREGVRLLEPLRLRVLEFLEMLGIFNSQALEAESLDRRPQ